MASYIFENRDEFEKLHYVRKADAKTNYWFSFNLLKLENYQTRFGDNFCLILIGSETQEDSYIMPFGEVKTIFSEENLVPKGNRWIGTVRNDVLRIHGTGEGIPILRYHNAFGFLDSEDNFSAVKESKATYLNEGGVSIGELIKKIRFFNMKYKETAPHKRHSISEQVARPGIISDYLKKIRDYTCQICGSKGFKQKNGAFYIEAHHIRELHELIPGSYCTDNIVVVCPTCHMKLHYADVEYIVLSDEKLKIVVNDVERILDRNIFDE